MENIKMRIANIESMIEMFNQSEKTADESVKIRESVESLDESLKLEKLKVFEHEFQTLPRDEFMRSFLNTRVYTGYRLAQNPKTGEFSLKEAERHITEKTLRKYLNRKEEGIAEVKPYIEIVREAKVWRHLPMFYDNMVRFFCKGIGTDSIRMNESARKEYSNRAEEGFPVVDSLNKLSVQLNTIVTEILPEGMEVPMNSLDVKALSVALMKATRMKFTAESVEKLLENILFCVEIRMNGKKYEVTSRDKMYRESK